MSGAAEQCDGAAVGPGMILHQTTNVIFPKLTLTLLIRGEIHPTVSIGRRLVLPNSSPNCFFEHGNLPPHKAATLLGRPGHRITAPMNEISAKLQREDRCPADLRVA